MQPQVMPTVSTLAAVIRDEVRHAILQPEPEPQPVRLEQPLQTRRMPTYADALRQPAVHNASFVAPSTRPSASHGSPFLGELRPRKSDVWRTPDWTPLCFHCGEAGHLYRTLSLLTGLAQVGEHKAPLLRVVKDHLGVEYCGFVFQKGCPLQHTFTNRYEYQAAGAPRKRQRLQWSEADTWSLIRLWEDNLHSLRAQTHNGEVYASIAAALTSAGVSRTKDQVHTKIENLTHTYRKCLKEKTTGSSPPNWPFFVKIQKFLGSLPVNDPFLMEEAGISSSPASSSPSVEELISGIVAGSSSDDTEVDAPEFTQASSAPQQPSNIQDCVTGRRNSSSDSGDGVRRKRRKYTGAEIKEKMLNEQRLLREQFEAAHKEEMEIRTKALKLQEKLVDAMVDF
ncbi:hypothetical protein HPB51_001313 [Rhipicephalus microplus]|uniref:Myb/SANT-like DNA-binding domain-containing protein n=1 Tax=Rhipicephalus microplus TaxID=6941 RepID=A0A9J6DY46_RHIMP|nr:hypothetical protein HPB51_001313 [Rhipicephalus microplus]